MLLQMKYRERVLGLILVSPLCKAPSWTEWFYNKVHFNSLQIFLYEFSDMITYSEPLVKISGDGKFDIFLRYVWLAERVFASAILQQGIMMQL